MMRKLFILSVFFTVSCDVSHPTMYRFKVNDEIIVCQSVSTASRNCGMFFECKDGRMFSCVNNIEEL